MKNANTPAMPVMNESEIHGQHYGLTKREHFAAMAPDIPSWYDQSETNFVKRYFSWRCFYADSMLMELESALCQD